MHILQIKMQANFEQFCLTQDSYRAQLEEIVESFWRYADKFAHQRASIDRQEVMLAWSVVGILPG